MRKPNFFIAGAPRSGTTALFYFLKQHPEIYMSGLKEPYYFCSDFHEESDHFHQTELRFPIRTEKAYLKLFQDAAHEKIVGEATPDYLYSKVAARNIYEFNKEAMILLSIRNPVDFLYSLHSHFLSYGFENIADFKKALDIEPMRRKGRHLPKGVFWPSSLYYSERMRFAEQIKRYFDYFPRRQVKILIFDDFKKDEMGAYKTILGFLGIDTSFTPTTKVHNENRVSRFNFVNRLFSELGDTKIGSMLPPKWRGTLAWKLREINSRVARRRPLDPSLRNTLMKQAKPEVEELSLLLNRDLLTLWNYEETGV
jgi:hypothetical protein